MTVDELYEQAQQLISLLLDEIVPPGTVRNREHLIELLEEGMKSPVSPMTAQDWKDIRHAVRECSARRNGLPSANA